MLRDLCRHICILARTMGWRIKIIKDGKTSAWHCSCNKLSTCILTRHWVKFYEKIVESFVSACSVYCTILYYTVPTFCLYFQYCKYFPPVENVCKILNANLPTFSPAFMGLFFSLFLASSFCFLANLSLRIHSHLDMLMVQEGVDSNNQQIYSSHLLVHLLTYSK